MTNLAKRLWPRATRQANGCLIWNGALDDHGYGVIGVGGKTPKAHRVAWELTHGPIPSGLNVLHTCDTPACIEPTHLFLGTQRDNMRDMRAKGRHAPPPLKKLGDADRERIRQRASAGEAQVALAREYGVSESLISQIVNHK